MSYDPESKLELTPAEQDETTNPPESAVTEQTALQVGTTDVAESVPQNDAFLPKKFKKLRKKLMQQYKTQLDKQKRAGKRLKTELDFLKKRIGKENYNFLLQICTHSVPEQKNGEGVVTKEAESIVNYEYLLRECRNLIVVNRNERILGGKRKRTTGTGRERSLHNAQTRFLNARNMALQAQLDAAKPKEEIKTVTPEIVSE